MNPKNDNAEEKQYRELAHKELEKFLEWVDAEHTSFEYPDDTDWHQPSDESDPLWVRAVFDLLYLVGGSVAHGYPKTDEISTGTWLDYLRKLDLHLQSEPIEKVKKLLLEEKLSTYSFERMKKGFSLKNIFKR